MMNPRRPSRAFSLVEMMVIIVILGIIANLSLAMFGSIDTTKLKSAVELLEADLNFARMSSLSHTDDLRRVSFDTASNSYAVVAASDTSTPITNPVDKKPYRVTFGEGRALKLDGIAIAGVSVGGDNLLGFEMYGQLDQTSDATITLTNGSKSVTLTLDAATGETTIGPIE